MTKRGGISKHQLISQTQKAVCVDTIIEKGMLCGGLNANGPHRLLYMNS